MVLPPDTISTESDVEQKLLMPLLKTLQYNDQEIRTKEYLMPTNLDKGAGKKIGYYPDYMVILAGLPILVIEAKAPDQKAEIGYREARLYASEINKLYPTTINPVKYVISSNGIETLISSSDSETDIICIKSADLVAGLKDFDFLVTILSRNALLAHTEELRNKLAPVKWTKPLRLLGGPSRQNAEIAANTFATDLIPLLRKYFDPDETSQSPEVLEKAYCASDELTKYNAELEALLKDKVLHREGIRSIETTKHEAELLTSTLNNIREIRDPLIMIIGNVGSGKSMFIERYHRYLMSDQLKDGTAWAVIDFNKAPDDLSDLQNWICREFINDFQIRHGDTDFLSYENLRRYFAPDIASRDRGPYKLIKATNESEYTTRITDDLTCWTDDPQKLSSGIIRYYSKDKGISVVVVFDNVDKRDRDQQLTVFQTVQWFRSKNQCFTILSLRDETFDAYKNKPPLDAFLKPFAFRIIPPRFVNVVRKRLELLIGYLNVNAQKTLSYTLPNGMQIRYPATNLGQYLMNIYVSVFNPSRKIRLILEALAGRNIRRALEMFTDILTSGYVKEDRILRMTEAGIFDMPEWLVIRILMRTNYRFFSDDHGYIQNIFDLPNSSTTANNFMLIEILEFLAANRKEKSTLQIEGYFMASDVINQIIKLGVTKEDVLWALELLLNRGLIIADHQRTKGIAEQDYIRITASGYYHVRMLATRNEYLSNVCVDTWFNDFEIAQKVSQTTGEQIEHRLERLTLLYEYLQNEFKTLRETFPEFAAAVMGSEKQINCLEEAIAFTSQQRLQFPHDDN